MIVFTLVIINQKTITIKCGVISFWDLISVMFCDGQVVIALEVTDKTIQLRQWLKHYI